MFSNRIFLYANFAISTIFNNGFLIKNQSNLPLMIIIFTVLIAVCYLE
jgi:hypothetical protein